MFRSIIRTPSMQFQALSEPLACGIRHVIRSIFIVVRGIIRTQNMWFEELLRHQAYVLRHY